MAGSLIEITLDSATVTEALSHAVEALDNPRPLFANIREYLLQAHQKRFAAQTAPDGTPWEPLSPRYRAKKKYNQNRILVLRGYLKNLLRGDINDNGVTFGTDRPYGAIHQFGGTIKHQARASTLHFRQNADGSVGNRFVKKSKSNFAQDVNIGAHQVEMPARPWLGLSSEDENYLLELTQHYLEQAMS